MESATTIQMPKDDKSAQNERSTIDFPYTDLENAVEVAKGVHTTGGTVCDSDQLAAHLKMEAKGGGFRQRISGAQMFGFITYERGGRISLTDLGKRVVDHVSEREARATAFLQVALYAKVYEDFKGGPLPGQAGLERAIATMGVGSKVADRARQVLLRSAKQAGFFEHAADRLVRPSIKADTSTSRAPAGGNEEKPPERKRVGGGDDGGSDDHHPLIRGLLVTLPKQGEEWKAADRFNWLTLANTAFKMIYKSDDGDVVISLKTGRNDN